MKKGKLINQPLSSLIAGLGHTDEIVIADAGLPIPDETQRIDLALTRGIPTFEETLKIVLEEMCVEKAYVSEEIEGYSPQMLAFIQDAIGDLPVDKIPHSQFKEQTKRSKAVVRTGEFTPYSNVILVAGPWGFDL
jgi:D-ribose pyranase